MISFLDDLFCALAVLFVFFAWVYGLALILYLAFITFFGGSYDSCG